MIRLLSVVALTVSLATVSLLQAQDAPPPPAPSVAPESSGRSAEMVASDLLAQRAIERIRRLRQPRVEDYVVLALALEQALEAHPNDDTLARRTAEAWRAADDSQRARDAVARLVRMSPDDTVAQLDLITTVLHDRQTAEERLRAYERFLGERAAGLDPSIRSRLALDASLIARETGDEEAFARLLSQAVSLDSTNKDAAHLAATLIQNDPNATPLERVEALANVVFADPVDPIAHLTLGRELLAQGAYTGAKRFLTLAGDLITRQTGTLADESIKVDLVVAEWATDGPEKPLADLKRAEDNAHYQIAQIRAQIERTGGDLADAPTFTPSVVEDRIRLALSTALGDLESVDLALTRIGDATRSAVADIEATLAETTELAERRRLLTSIAGLEMELLWARLVSGRQFEDALAQMTALEDERFNDVIRDEALNRYRGWTALRSGDFDGARALLDTIADDDARAALGVALLAEGRQETIGAARLYARIALDEPGTLLGMFARDRIRVLLGQPVQLTPTARELEEYARALPDAIDRMTRDPQSYIDIRVRQNTRRIDMLDRLEATISIRNAGRFPMRLGAGAPIDSRLLLSPRFTSAGRPVLDGLTPEVVSMARKLRLMPGESVTANVWLGQGSGGLLLARNPAIPFTIRWRALQAFYLTTQGDYRPGVQGVTAESDILARPASDLTTITPLEIAERIETSAGEAFVRALHVGGWMARSGAGIADEEEQFIAVSGIAQVTAARVAEMSDAERAITLLLFPAGSVVGAAAPIDEAIDPTSGRLCAMAWLSTRVTSATDPLLTQLIDGDDPVLVEMAANLRAALAGAAPAPTRLPAQR